ncbi:hypothetical protein NDU88_004883 [Pleurodeles waltl]|uniref:Uncharacterized protein n=1 Tax=Pleurodeles waltl TaxID=8319 RepID=A0AAV7WVM5_PLEWA|nr:hypothetical protein NDU88_004883 [Pleurodeles waltl]
MFPRPSRGSGAPGRALQPALPRWAPSGPTGTPSAPRVLRAKAECVQMAALRARPSGLTENPGHLVAIRAGLLWRVQMAGLPRPSRGGPGSGPPILQDPPSPMGPGPGVSGGSAEASLAAPGGQVPRVGPSRPPACPAPMGPGTGVRRARGGLPGGQGPRVGPFHPPACPAPVGFPGSPGGQGPRVGPSQPALPRWAPDGPTGTPSAPRAKAECVQMATLRAQPSGLTENPPRWFAMARPDGRAAAEVLMRAHLLPRAQPGLQEVVCVLADGPLRHSVRTNSQERPKSSSGLLGTGYAGPPRGPVVQGFSTGRPVPGWRGRLLAPSSDGSLLRTWLPREQTAAPGPASTVHRSIGHTWSVWGWTAWPASAVVSSKELPTPPGTVRLAGLPFLGRPFLAERRPSSPAACALPAVRPEWKGVGWRQVLGSRPYGGPGTQVPSPASSFTQRIFPSSSERPFRGVSPPVPAGRHPLRPPLRLRLGPAVSLPRRWLVPAGSCATALSSTLRWGAKDGPRRACGYSPQQVRLPG